jgi:NAD(P)-dependent dehydrogenase (short-subunit alcohol dehydrogenase family)
MRVKDRVAVVTGAASGIGRAIALGLAREGAHVAIMDVNGELALKTADEIRGLRRQAEVYPGSVSDQTFVGSAVDRIAERFGAIDILINSAGVISSTPFLELPGADLRRIFEINVFGLVYVSQAVGKIMVARSTGGAILNVSSLNGEAPLYNVAHYTASKAAVSMFTRSMALELAPYRIRVNEIRPASIETELTRKAMQDPENRRMRIETIPLGRIGQPEDMVGAAIFLCSDEASWITGASLLTDGGLSLVPPMGKRPSRY